jgi:NADH dehydrogenase/NADH:ubiquinone oxidoreductase subunit G
MADVILPTPAYTEKSGTYVNLEGRVQRTTPAVGRLVQAREDWSIIRALSEIVGKPLPYNTLADVRARLNEVSPTFSNLDCIESISYTEPSYHTNRFAPALKGNFTPYLENFFFTDVIARASKIMAKCVQTLPTATNSYIKAQTNTNSTQSEMGAKKSANATN